MPNKFKVGDRVVLNRASVRLPKWIQSQVFVSQKRRITSIHYSRRTRHTHYHLGHNGRGLDISPYPFRASELKPYKMKLHTMRLKRAKRGSR